MIQMNDFKREYAYLKSDLAEATTRVMESGWYVLGAETEAFEKEFAEYVGAGYCVGVANGLEALQIALIATGIQADDEVITVSNSAVATSLAISAIGARPVFVDVDEFYHLDVDQLETCISDKTKAILPVHLFGQMVDMQSVKEIAQKYNLVVIEDACQAHGATFQGKHAGTFGEIGCFSFYPTKNLGAMGDAGALITNNKQLYEVCMLLRNYGQKTRYYHQVKGMNSRLDELQASILRAKLPHLTDMIKKRRERAEWYIQRLNKVPQVILPKQRAEAEHAFHLFVVEVAQRDVLAEWLRNNGVEALIHYPVPIHKQACYPEYSQVYLPKTEAYATNILSLPIHPFLSEEEVETVCKLITTFYTTHATT